jgi:hypothetical protein
MSDAAARAAAKAAFLTTLCAIRGAEDREALAEWVLEKVCEAEARGFRAGVAAQERQLMELESTRKRQIEMLMAAGVRQQRYREYLQREIETLRDAEARGFRAGVEAAARLIDQEGTPTLEEGAHLIRLAAAIRALERPS